MNNGYIYLASPYSHDDEAVREQRYRQVLEASADYLRQGHFIYSPIAHCHEMSVRLGLPTDWRFWAAYDEAMISGASALWVLTLDGHEQSVGVKAEIEIARRLGIPVSFVSAVDELRQASGE